MKGVEKDHVAIVGMACLFPGAPDLATFAKNLREGRDAISDVPAGRWDAAFYDPAAPAGSADRFYCKRGGFVDAAGDARFDPVAHGVMPVAAKVAEPDQLLALDVAVRAVADAGLTTKDFDRRRAGVILGRGNYSGTGRTRLTEHVRGAEQLARALRSLIPSLDDAQIAQLKEEYRARLGAVGEGGEAIGLVPNLTASRIAHRLDYAGPAYTVDAACASALLAVDQAVTQLRAGRLDVVLAGGVHFCQDEAFWSVFCQLGALSHAQQIRPFDRRADGILIGEGAGIVVLKRAADAERDGDRVYAIIRGTGVASDGREASLMNPRVEGQVLALERAWEDARVDPATVGLVEAHGTGTPAGDAAELETLRRVFGAGQGAPAARAVLGSVKSMIGHAMPAAGAAGLIKAALALSAGELWPTLHCEDPHPALRETRFRTIGAAEPWTARADGAPRRAAVNAFGFGGIDAHVVLEEAPGASSRGRKSAPPATAERRSTLLALAAESPEALLAALAAPTLRLPDAAHPVVRAGAGACRLALLDPTTERVARACVVVEKGKPWRGREGIFFAPRGLVADGGKIAFAYPGVDASFRPRLDDVAAHFGRTLPPEAREARNVEPGTPAPALPGQLRHDRKVPRPNERSERAPRTIEEIGLGLVAAGRLLHDALVALGITPDLALGHSVGEWTGMIATGMIPEAEADDFIARVRPGTLEVPGVVFAALGCGQERALAAMEGLESIAVSHDNCPRQVIVCGHEASVDTMLARLREAGVLGQKLPFRSGFHSPLFADFIAPHRENFAGLPLATPRLPLWSATSVAPYPKDEAAVRTLAIDHLVQPVRFRELAERLHDEGVRVFVQVGTGSLVGFLEDSLRPKGAHLAISANVADRSGLEQLERVVAQLFVEGAEPRWEVLWKASAAEAPAAPAAKARTIPLALGVPLVEFAAPLSLPHVPIQPAPALPKLPSQGVAAAFAEMLGAIDRAASDVITLLEQQPARTAALPAPRPVTTPAPAAPAAASGPRERRVVRRLSAETHPWLIDHTFFRQPPGWPTVSDRHPVVPMTTSIHFMMTEAEAFVPGTVAVGIEDVHAFRWLAIPGPTDVAFELRFDGRDRVAISIDGFAEGTVVLAPAYEAAPDAPPQLLAPLVARPDAVPAERPSPLPAERIYVERYMFHGPAYQGIRAVGPVWGAGLRGELECGAAPGALLDNAGQLFGFWMMISAETDRLAMPVGIEKIRFYSAHPRPGARLRCDVRITLVDQRRVIADLTLADARTGKVWCEIGGWEDRRFDTDPRLWNVLIWPERHALAEPQPEGWVHYRDIYRAAATREQLYRRYLGEAERAVYEKIQPRGQRAHLAGRIALKDAVRDFLWKRGHGELFPVEIAVSNDEQGRPVVRVPGELDLRVSLAHKGDLAVAIVAEGRDVGIDLETIEPRPAGFAGLAFGDDELALRRPGEDEAEFMTRLWTAKEAVGKLLGTGLSGNPRKLKVTDRTGERLLCHGYHVDTRRDGDHVIGWTYAP